MDNHLTDEQFEELLREAVIKDFEKEIASIPPREELEKMYTFSDRHNARMEKLFRKARRDDVVKAALKRLRGIAAIFAIIVTVLFGTLLTSQQVRATVLDTIALWFDGFTKFVSSDGSNGVVAVREEWRPRFMPSGFAESEVIVIGEITHITYEDAERNSITMIFAPASSSKSVNNEGVEYDVATIGGTTYHMFKSVDDISDNAVVWEMGETKFELFSQIPVETLMAIAQSTEKK